MLPPKSDWPMSILAATVTLYVLLWTAWQWVQRSGPYRRLRQWLWRKTHRQRARIYPTYHDRRYP